jgi:hypothetical protein
MRQSIQIQLQVEHPGYSFPSHTKAAVDSFLYDNLYHGQLITVDEKTLINFDIPMDSAKPSKTPLLVKSPSIAVGEATAAMADTAFWIGLVAVPLAFILNTNPFTFGILCLYLGVGSLRLFGIGKHPYGTVSDVETGRAMPFALVTLNATDGQRKAFTVSDEKGRYVLAAGTGKEEYKIAVHTPANIQPPRTTEKTIKPRRGWVTSQVIL